MKKKLLVTLLSFVMVVTMMPLSVFASTANSEKGGNAEYTVTFATNPSEGGTVKIYDSFEQKYVEGNTVQVSEGSMYWLNDDNEIEVYDEESGDVFSTETESEDEYTFTGWDPEVTEESVDITEDMTFTANFEKDEPETGHTVTFTANPTDGGKFYDLESETYVDSVEVLDEADWSCDDDSQHTITITDDEHWYTIEPKAAEGHNFTDWEGVEPGDEGKITQNMTFTANFPTPTQQYTVVFYMQGHGTQVPAQTVDANGYATEPTAPTAAGYEFEGWFTESTCENQFDFQNTPITKNIGLYAKWTEQPTTGYKLDFTANPSGGGQFYDKQNKKYVEEINVPTASHWWLGEDHIIQIATDDGWYKIEPQPAGGHSFTDWEGVEPGDEGDITQDMSFTANFPTSTEYTITKTLSTGVADISAQVEGTEASKAVAGATVVVSANPDSSHQIANILIQPEDETIDPIILEGDEGQFPMPASNVTITATAVDPATTYTVTFDSQGGTAVVPQVVEAGQCATKPTDPTKSGATFDGWFDEATSTTEPFDFATQINSDLTLTAHWTEQPTTEYTITKTTTEGVASISAKVEDTEAEAATAGTTVFVSATPDSGYEIGHITVTPDSGIPTVIGFGEGQFTMPASNVTITASVVDPADQYVLTFVADPSEGGTIQDCTTKEEVEEIVVSGEESYYYIDKDGDIQVIDDTASQYPAFTAVPNQGWEFTGWNPTSEVEDYIPITSDTTLTANFEQVAPVTSHTVTFNSQGGTKVPTQTVEDGEFATEPTAPTKEGSTFNGWFTTPEAAGEAFDFENTPIKSNITLFADWTENQYTITKTITTGVASISAKVEDTEVEATTFGKTVMVSADPDSAHVIDTITITPDSGTRTVITGDHGQFTMPASNVTITATAVDPSEYVLSFVADPSDGGTIQDCDTKEQVEEIVVSAEESYYYIDRDGDIQVIDDTAAQYPAFTAVPNQGWKFTGWDPSSEVEEYIQITSDTTLTAKFEPATTCTVTFDSQGGTAVDPQVVEAGQCATKPADPTKSGATFAGWFDEATSTTEPFDFATPINSDLTLTAHWTEGPTTEYTITKTLSTGVADISAQVEGTEASEAVAGATVVVTATPDSSHQIANILIQPEDETIEPTILPGDEGQFTMPASNVTITATAVEPATTHTVTFTAEGPGHFQDENGVNITSMGNIPDGTEYYAPESYPYFYIEYNPDPSALFGYSYVYPVADEGYVFAGWDFEPLEGTLTGDLEVKAIFREIEMHAVTFTAAPTEGGTIVDRDTEEPIDSVTVLDGTTYSVDDSGNFNLFNSHLGEYWINEYFKATPAAGYKFVGWEPSTEGTVTSDMTVKAKFEKEHHVIPQVTGLKAKATDSKTASVTWNQIIGHYGIKYEVWRSAGTSGDFKKVATTASNSYKDTKVITGTKYTYKVRAICEGQTGEFSDTDYAYPRLFKVTNFSAKALNAAKAQVAWNANGNKNVSYQVYRSTKPNTGFKKVATVTDGKTTYSQTFTPAQSGMKYYYKVRATTKDYTGKWHYGAFSKVDYAYPRVGAVGGFESWAPNAKCAKVHFNPLTSKNTQYWIYKGTKPYGDWGSPIAKVSGKDSTYTDKNVKAGHKYYYMLRAVQVIDGKTYFGPYTKMDYAYPR